MNGWSLHQVRRALLCPILAMLLASFVDHARAQHGVNVVTQHYDNRRSGANLQETQLNTFNVDFTRFGKLFTRTVSGQIFAQPLIVSGLDMPNFGLRNVVFVVTQNNILYAFDADDPQASAPYWSVSLGTPVSPPPIAGVSPAMGVTSTPVIDLTTNTIYVCAYNKLTSGRAYYLHALDLLDGHPKFGSPVRIQPSSPGTGDGSVNGVIAFNPFRQIQRASLLLLNGKVYIAFASFADVNPYHGWVLGYDAANLQSPPVITNLTPDGKQGGIWQGGQGPAADDQGNIYVSLGNGSFTVRYGGRDFGSSVVKLSTADGGLTPVDFFTPFNVDLLNSKDLDVGSSGPMLIPNTNLLIGGGKLPYLFLLDCNNMGGFNPTSNSQICQTVFHTGAHLHSGAVYWDSPSGGMIYIWPEVTTGQQFGFSNGKLSNSPLHVTRMSAPGGMPGGMISISANGNQQGSGILWVCIPASNIATKGILPGMFRAFDASDISHELWNSKQFEVRDDVPTFGRFVAPVVANGKVYIATFSNQLLVYGLLPQQIAPFAPMTLDAMPDIGKVNLNWSASVGADCYKVKRSSISGGPYDEIATNIQATTYTDSAVSAGQRYYYVVSAVNSGGESSNSEEAAAGGASIIQQLPIAADTFVRSGTFASQNFGKNTTLSIRRTGSSPSLNDIRVAHIKLDLQSVTGAPVAANLVLTIQPTTQYGPETVSFFTQQDSTWTELGLVYNNTPGLDLDTGFSTGAKIKDKHIRLEGGVINIDVTDLVKQNLGGFATIQILLDHTSSASVGFMSRNATTGKPVLTIAY